MSTTSNGAAPPSPQVTLLVLADAIWVKWGPEVSEPDGKQPWQRHKAFLERLLCDDRGRWDGYILHEPEWAELAGPWGKSSTAERDALAGIRTAAMNPIAATDSYRDGPAARSSRRPAWAEAPAELRVALAGRISGSATQAGGPAEEDPADLRWCTGAAAKETAAKIVEGVRRCNDVIDRRVVTNLPLVGAVLNLHGCRIYLEPRQLSRLWRRFAWPAATPTGTDLPHVCLDLRFRSHLGNYWLYATLSLWTHGPASRAHSPKPAVPTQGGRGPIPHEARRDQLLALRDLFANQFARDFHPLSPTVFGRPYRPPRFWIAALDRLPDTTTAESLNDVGQALIGVPVSSSSVDFGKITGRAGPSLHVIRRFAGAPVSAPSYLIVPCSSPDPAAQEDAVRALVQRLNRDEARAAAELFDISTDLDMAGSLVRSYAWVEKRLSVLWDELSMYLPTASGRDLNRLHALAELINQVLLQGIADLELVHADTHRLTGAVTALAARSIERFDDEGFVEEEPGKAGSVRESIQRGGYFALTGREAQQTCESAGRARDAYRAMLEGIAHAFDERRVRVTDRLGLYAVGFGVLLATTGGVTEIWGAWLGKETDRPTLLTLWLLALAGYLLLVGAAGLLAYWRLGRLSVQREFRIQYTELKKFLLRCRTDHLEELRKRWRDEVTAAPPESRPVADRWAPYFTKWNAVDDELAKEYVKRLDALKAFGDEDRRASDPTAPVEELKRSRSIVELRSSVEKWALIALLVSERPRSFYGFPLPMLALLYRFYPIEALGGNNDDDGPDLVSDSDLRLSLRAHWHVSPDDIDRIQSVGAGWTAKVKDPVSAWTPGQVLAEIRKFTVHAGMPHDKADEAIKNRLRGELG